MSFAVSQRGLPISGALPTISLSLSLLFLVSLYIHQLPPLSRVMNTFPPFIMNLIESIVHCQILFNLPDLYMHGIEPIIERVWKIGYLRIYIASMHISQGSSILHSWDRAEERGCRYINVKAFLKTRRGGSTLNRFMFILSRHLYPFSHAFKKKHDDAFMSIVVYRFVLEKIVALSIYTWNTERGSCFLDVDTHVFKSNSWI